MHRAGRTFARGLVVPLFVAAAFLSLIGGCGLVVSFEDYGFDAGGRGARDAGLYTVKGTVFGFEQRGAVTLALNVPSVTDQRRITVGDGPFAFPATLPDRSSFVLTVLEQPPGNPCVLDHAAGTIAGKDADGVVVACPSNNARLDSLTIDICYDYGSDCGRTLPVTLGFAPSTFAYEISVPQFEVGVTPPAYTLLRIRARTAELGARTSFQGGFGEPPKFDPQTLSTVAYWRLQTAFRIAVDIDAPDRHTHVSYVVATSFSQVTP